MQAFAEDLSEDGELIFHLLLIHQNNLSGHIWGCSAALLPGNRTRQRKQPQIVPVGVQLGYQETFLHGERS